MRGLRKYLTPFAPDQSGAVSVLYELGGIIVIGQLRQDVFQFAGVAAVAQDVACLPLHPGFFFMRLGIFAKFAYAEP